MKILYFLILIFLVFSKTSFYSLIKYNFEPIEEKEELIKFNLNFTFGSLYAFDNFNTFQLIPSITIGPLYLQFNLQMDFDLSNNFILHEWNTINALLMKLDYISIIFNKPYFKFELTPIYDLILCNGFILDFFSNQLLFPIFKKRGLLLDTDLDHFGGKLFLDNFLDPDIFGGRLFYRPLFILNIPFYKNLEIGITAIIDTDTQNPLPDTNYPYKFEDSPNSSTNNFILVYGADLKIPFYSNQIINIGSQIEFASVYKKGYGILSGISASFFDIIPLKYELRFFEKGFYPEIFNAFYEVNRNILLEQLGETIGTTNNNSYFISGGLNLFNKMIDITIDYEHFAKVDPLTNKVTIKVYFSKEWSRLIGFKLVYFRKNLLDIRKLFDFDHPDCYLYWIMDYNIADFLSLNIGFNKSYFLNRNREIQLYVGSFFTTTIKF